MNISQSEFPIKRTIDRLLATLVAASMAALVLVVLWQVFSRCVLNRPSTNTDELARFLLVCVGLLGAAYTTGIERHLAVNLIDRRLSGDRKRTVVVLRHLVTACFSASVMITGGSYMALRTIATGQTCSSVDIPLGYFYLILPLSGLFVLFYSSLFITTLLSELRSDQPR